MNGEIISVTEVVYSFIRGDMYSGEFKDNKKHGRGAAYYITGNFYEGMWIEDKWHGPGERYWQARGTKLKHIPMEQDILVNGKMMQCMERELPLLWMEV